MPTTPTQTSTAAAPSAAVQALNASREAAYNAKQNVYSGNNANLATFSAANPTLNTAGGSGTAPAQVPTQVLRIVLMGQSFLLCSQQELL
jgi:hypothetical protein